MLAESTEWRRTHKCSPIPIPSLRLGTPLTAFTELNQMNKSIFSTESNQFIIDSLNPIETVSPFPQSYPMSQFYRELRVLC